jgi:hypothetical protein
MNKEINLFSPWVIYYKKLEALFGKDKDIKMTFDNNELVVKMYINGQDKYEALSQLIPVEKQFGTVTLKIQLIPANNLKQSKVDLFRKAFYGNPIVNDIIVISRDVLESTNDFSYVVFAKEVVQYHDDSLNDPHGNCSTLYQDIAKEVFENCDGIYFCTDNE